MKYKIDLVIPTYSITYELRDLAYKCALSHKSKVDKIIITEDGGMFSNQLRDIADIYVYNQQNVGFSKNVNKGWGLSDADFTIIANSDTELVDGNLIDFCEKETVCCPEIINLPHSSFTGSYFVVPKSIKEKFGLLDERMKNFGSDTDYYERIKEYFREEKRVKILHHKSQTLKETGWNTQKEAQKDAQIYKEIVNTEYPERRDDI